MRPMYGVFSAAVLTIGCAGCAQSDGTDTTPIAQPSIVLEQLSGFAGEYVVVDVRRASDVSSPLNPMDETPLGKIIRFTVHGIEFEGVSCDEWSVTPSEEGVIPIEQDPLLVDLKLGAVDSPKSRGDQQEHQSFHIVCEGEVFSPLHKVDDRVLVMPWENSSLNLILERPLTELQTKTYQMQLKSMKFYSGDITGELDAATLKASRVWYRYRADLDDQMAVPARPAMTENLLDGLGVVRSD